MPEKTSLVYIVLRNATSQYVMHAHILGACYENQSQTCHFVIKQNRYEYCLNKT